MLNVVDDQPTPAHDWLPEMAAMLGGPAPRHVPAWLARLLVGEWGVAYMTGLAGAANTRPRPAALEAHLQRLAGRPDRGPRLAGEEMTMRTITLEEHCDGEHATTLGSKELSMTSTTTSRSAGGRSSLLTAPALAGLAYLVAWVAGLAVWPSNLDVAASGG